MSTPKVPDIRADSLLTSYQVGALLQVNPSSVNKWVKDGRISAFRTPGGHRRIRAADLVAFLSEHQMPIPQNLQHAARRRLLVVDDDAGQLESLQRLFEPYHDRIELQVAHNGVDALVHVGSFKPHLIVLDLALKHIDGLEVCRRLKASAQTQDIRVVLAIHALTAELRSQAAAAGAKGCIDKPLTLNALLGELGLAVSASPV